jgi:hypothetical protein
MKIILVTRQVGYDILDRHSLEQQAEDIRARGLVTILGPEGSRVLPVRDVHVEGVEVVGTIDLADAEDMAALLTPAPNRVSMGCTVKAGGDTTGRWPEEDQDHEEPKVQKQEPTRESDLVGMLKEQVRLWGDAYHHVCSQLERLEAEVRVGARFPTDRRPYLNPDLYGSADGATVVLTKGSAENKSETDPVVLELPELARLRVQIAALRRRLRFASDVLNDDDPCGHDHAGPLSLFPDGTCYVCGKEPPDVEFEPEDEDVGQ